MKVSRSLARRMALHAQLLDGRAKLPAGKEGVARTIESLGYIQIDTIAVIRRAHHHTLWTRRPDYRSAMLHELQAVDRRVFEYWGHAASYLPMSDYRFYLPKMRAAAEPRSKWARRWLAEYGHLMKPVRRRIREEGPLSSKDFVPPPGTKRGPWWGWKPAKVALEMLFWRGELMIRERRNFERVYDLTERVLPRGVDCREPDAGESGRFFARRALAAHGVAREAEIHRHLHGVGREVIARGLRDLLDGGEVVRLELEGAHHAEHYALRAALERGSRLRGKKPQLLLLSPFDNLVIQRERIARLFGFDYVLECYLPAAQRKHGYFTLPVLWGERFIGRLDPKAERETGRLIVRRLHLQKDAAGTDEWLPALAEALFKLARFNGCGRVVLERTSPPRIKKELVKHLVAREAASARGPRGETAPPEPEGG